MTKKFYGTIEYITGQPAAIITLTNEQGAWEGSERIDLPKCPPALLAETLYDSGYTRLTGKSLAKGGRLERFRVLEDATHTDNVPTAVDTVPPTAVTVRMGGIAR